MFAEAEKKGRRARKGGQQQQTFFDYKATSSSKQTHRARFFRRQVERTDSLVAAATRTYLPVATPSGGPGCSIVVVRGLQEGRFFSRRRSACSFVFLVREPKTPESSGKRARGAEKKVREGSSGSSPRALLLAENRRDGKRARLRAERPER